MCFQWGRAKSLLAAYQKHVTLSLQDEPVPLTTADVYCWMVDEGLFLRDTPKNLVNSVAQDPRKDTGHIDAGLLDSATYCFDCGLRHGSMIKSESSPNTADCPYVRWRVRGFPIMDITQILSAPPAGRASKCDAIAPMKLRAGESLDHDLVATSDPMLVLAVRDLVESLRLETFRSVRGLPSVFPLNQIGANTAEIDQHMAPFAVLSIAMKMFLGILVKGGLHAADRDWAIDDGRWKTGIRVLTPSHVVRGMYTSSHSEMWAMLACCLRIGMSFNPTAAGNIDAVPL